MFSDKAYLMVNREERFFCAVLYHVLLSSSSVRECFLRKCSPDAVDADCRFYFEVAMLRDYWHDLGDNNDAKKTILTTVLDMKETGLGEEALANEFFWSKKKDGARGDTLVIPAAWRNIEQFAAARGDRLEEKLYCIRHCFNAKPDFAIIGSGVLVFIEAKWESSEGKDSRESKYYSQYDIQSEAAHMVRELVPVCNVPKGKVTNVVMARSKPRELGSKSDRQISFVAWKSVIESIKADPSYASLDGFSRDVLDRMWLRVRGDRRG